MLKLDNVSKEFKRKILFKNSFISIDRSGLYGIVGSNGSGKTTLLKMLHLQEQPSNGTIENTYSTVYVDVKNLVFSKLSVWDNLKIICEDEKRIEEIIEDFFLAELKNQTAKSLSMGEKVRVAIARAILLNSQVILLDEPTANLDGQNRLVLLDILKKISLDRIIIFTTNQEADLDSCDVVFRIENQKVEASGGHKGREIEGYRGNTYTNLKILKRALGGYGYIYRMISISFLLLFSILLSIYCIRSEDIVYHSYEFDKPSSYMLIEKDYLSKSNYEKIDKTMYETQAVKASTFPFFLYEKKIDNSQIAALKDIEILKKIPNTVYVHYESQKYNLADDEIVMTEDLYNLFMVFSQIQNSNFTFGDITLKIRNVETGSTFTRIENIVTQNETRTLEFMDDFLKKPNFDLDELFSLLRYHLFDSCSEVELRAKDIENSHIYLTRATYERLYQETIHELPILEPLDLASFKIIKNDFVDLDAKKIIISAGFCESFMKGYRIEDILRGMSPTYFEVSSNLKLYYQVAGVVNTDKEFIAFLEDNYIDDITIENIQKDFDEIFILPEESRSVFDDVYSRDLILVMPNYHSILERLDSFSFLLPSLYPFLISIGILLGILILVLSFVPLLRKRHAIALLANSNRSVILKRNFNYKISLISLACLFFSIILAIIITPCISLLIYDIWSFDFVSWSSIFSLHLVGYLWIEVIQKLLFFKWIK